MRHDSPATVKGSKHVCKTAGCKPNNYKERPRKDRTGLLGSAMPNKNHRVMDKNKAMKAFPRSERQARKVLAQAQSKKDNAEYYQNHDEWKSPRRG